MPPLLEKLISKISVSTSLVPITLAFNHRIISGAKAARFINNLCEISEITENNKKFYISQTNQVLQTLKFFSHFQLKLYFFHFLLTMS